MEERKITEDFKLDENEERMIMLWNVMMDGLNKYLHENQENISLKELFTIINLGVSAEIIQHIPDEDKHIVELGENPEFTKVAYELARNILVGVNKFIANGNGKVKVTDIITAVAFVNTATVDLMNDALKTPGV